MNNNEMLRKINKHENKDIPELREQLEHNTSQINSIIQIPLTKYYFLKDGNDWSSAIEKTLLDYPRGEVYIPKGNYEFSRGIVLNENQSIKLDYGATIKAIASMDIFIQRHGTLSNYTRLYNFENAIYGGGVIDCNGFANVGISLGGYRGFRLRNLTILDALNYGVVSKVGDYACELFADDLRIETRNERTDINSTAMLINSSDNHISNVVMVDTLIGIECTDFSNRFYGCHHWMRDRIKDKDLGCTSFRDTGAFNTYDTCFGDSSNIGFETGGGNTFVNCEYFNSQHFNATNVTAIKFNKEITSLLVIENFRVRGDGTENVLNALNGTVNSNVRLVNCYCNHLVTNKFPRSLSTFDSIEADYIESLGDVKAKVVRSDNKVQCPNYNFTTNQWLHCNENNIVMLNNYPLMQLVPVPTSYTSPGAYGQFAYDTQYFYLYIVNVGWKRIALGEPW